MEREEQFWLNLNREWGEDRAQEARKIYREIDSQCSQWSMANQISCSKGCGHCCEPFTPEITRSEAEIVALWLLSAPREEAETTTSVLDALTFPWEQGDGCPIALKDNPHHCPIYPVRPLICRLFGFSGMTGKNGNWSFTLCRWMEAPGDWESPMTGSLTGEKPPLMDSFGSLWSSIDPSGEAEREPLPRAILRSYQRLALIKQLSESEQFGKNNEETPPFREPPKSGPTGRRRFKRGA